MKHLIAGVIGLTCCCACQNKKPTIDPFAAITNEVDSVRSEVDSTYEAKSSKEPMPIEEDDSFDDFIYRFASDRDLQSQRIAFPLPYSTDSKKVLIEKKYWKHDNLFIKQGFYSLLFDSEKDMDIVENAEPKSVRVEFIYIKSHMMKQFCFQKRKGAWMLNAINLKAVSHADGEDFMEFYGRFATDSLFQSRHVENPLAFVTTDPDDDFSILETTLDLNQWFAFKPDLPTEYLLNVDYGQKSNVNSSIKIIALKGIGNGFSNILHFQRKESGWGLCKFEDTSI